MKGDHMCLPVRTTKLSAMLTKSQNATLADTCVKWGKKREEMDGEEREEIDLGTCFNGILCDRHLTLKWGFDTRWLLIKDIFGD